MFKSVCIIFYTFGLQFVKGKMVLIFDSCYIQCCEHLQLINAITFTSLIKYLVQLKFFSSTTLELFVSGRLSSCIVRLFENTTWLLLLTIVPLLLQQFTDKIHIATENRPFQASARLTENLYSWPLHLFNLALQTMLFFPYLNEKHFIHSTYKAFQRNHCSIVLYFKILKSLAWNTFSLSIAMP